MRVIGSLGAAVAAVVTLGVLARPAGARSAMADLKCSAECSQRANGLLQYDRALCEDITRQCRACFDNDPRLAGRVARVCSSPRRVKSKTAAPGSMRRKKGQYDSLSDGAPPPTLGQKPPRAEQVDAVRQDCELKFPSPKAEQIGFREESCLPTSRVSDKSLLDMINKTEGRIEACKEAERIRDAIRQQLPDKHHPRVEDCVNAAEEDQERCKSYLTHWGKHCTGGQDHRSEYDLGCLKRERDVRACVGNAKDE